MSGWDPSAFDGVRSMQDFEMLVTVAELAARCHCAPYRVEYILQSRGINPCAWVGHTRLFNEEQAQQIQTELAQIGAARASRKRRRIPRAWQPAMDEGDLL